MKKSERKEKRFGGSLLSSMLVALILLHGMFNISFIFKSENNAAAEEASSNQQTTTRWLSRDELATVVARDEIIETSEATRKKVKEKLVDEKVSSNLGEQNTSVDESAIEVSGSVISDDVSDSDIESKDSSSDSEMMESVFGEVNTVVVTAQAIYYDELPYYKTLTLKMLDEKVSCGEPVTTGEIIWAINNYMTENGFSVAAVSGVASNIGVESQFSPYAQRAGYYGMCQWNNLSVGEYWWTHIQTWIKSEGLGVYSFEGQVRAIFECPKRGLLSDKLFEELKTLDNPRKASELFCVYYEGCTGGRDLTEYYYKGHYYQELSLRKSEADLIFQMLNDESMEYTGQKPYCG